LSFSCAASIASIAGQNLKKTVMELGGSDAYIILDDVDLEKTTATFEWTTNNGQTCIAAKRFMFMMQSIF
jgi:succinate-semialdehyde dehydrogenase/glutarate-semialdehyde dehydrogenase